MTRVIVAGGGLAGCLSALALARARPDVEILLIEQGETFGGNHTWSFFDTDVSDENRWVLDGISASHWDEHHLSFPKRERTIAIGYNSIRSEALDACVRDSLSADQYLLGRRIAELAPTSVTLLDGTCLHGDAVIDARGMSRMPGLTLAWQKFLGITYRWPTAHGVSKPVIMDATVEQLDGYRFIYQLPISDNELLIEDTYYSASPDLDEDALRARVAEAARPFGTAPDIIAEERGILPIVLSGEVESLWDGVPLPRIGIRGGFFHPTTSYSLPDAVATAALLCRQPDLTTRSLHAVLKQRAVRLWHERSFFRLLNRMLFRAAEPHDSYRVLEHFYRLPPPVIARFYAAQLTALDKLRVLSGRPPVPIGRALRAIRPGAA